MAFTWQPLGRYPSADEIKQEKSNIGSLYVTLGMSAPTWAYASGRKGISIDHLIVEEIQTKLDAAHEANKSRCITVCSIEHATYRGAYYPYEYDYEFDYYHYNNNPYENKSENLGYMNADDWHFYTTYLESVYSSVQSGENTSLCPTNKATATQ
jgi:hypothetical protein